MPGVNPTRMTTVMASGKVTGHRPIAGGGSEFNPGVGPEVGHKEDQSRSTRGQSRSQSNISILYFLTHDAALILKRPSGNIPLQWNTRIWVIVHHLFAQPI